MGTKQTLKALEELVKTEYMAVGALDAAIEEVEDSKLRKQYRKFRDSHMNQAEALNDRIEDLGGEPLDYEVGSGKGQASLWGKITGVRDDSSVAGMRIGAERGIKRYIDHIDDLEDPKALNIVRKNLEAKQEEIKWFDDQISKEREKGLETKVEVSKEKAMEYSNGHKKGGLPFPLILAIGAVGAAAYFLLRRSDESEFDDYGEDAFRYEGEEAVTDSGFSSTDSFSGGDQNVTEYNPSTNASEMS
jgi:bacterioferritin (cytochrome b1)